MTDYKLNLPPDIPWKRICVTEDMIDSVVCDERLPAKWQTSMAVFKYKPEDMHQVHAQYDITYLKVVATITGYQPLDKEIQGKIDWDGVNVETEITNAILKDLLSTYHPCTGAILQVVVGPKEQNSNIPLNDYPFFMDFNPKQKEFFELTDDISGELIQSYNSLNSYHLGTNRAIFLIQPKPYLLIESNDFVRGPRPVDGIQEFYLVVAQPKGQSDFCVSLRLDTSHLVKKTIMDYERIKIESGEVWATVIKPEDYYNPGAPLWKRRSIHGAIRIFWYSL